MALVEGGKQRAISVDYPVYYSPGACLDILNGFMADAGDPALGGGGRRRGGSGEAPAPPLGHPGQRPETPRGSHGPREGARDAPRGIRGVLGRASIPHPPSRTPIPTPAALCSRPSCALPTGVLPRVQSLWESGAGAAAGASRSTKRSPERQRPGGSATPTPRRDGHPPSPARSAHAPLLVNY